MPVDLHVIRYKNRILASLGFPKDDYCVNTIAATMPIIAIGHT